MSRREHKVIHAVGCPSCGVGRGDPCVPRSKAERATKAARGIFVHDARRALWQAERSYDPDFYSRPEGRQYEGALRPISERARRAALSIHGAREDGDVIRVEDLGEAVDLLIEKGFDVRNEPDAE